METAAPEGVAFFRKVCEEMSKVPGVMFCDYAWTTSDIAYVDPETKTRTDQAVVAGTRLQKVSFTKARIQWVYKENSTNKIVIGKPGQSATPAKGVPAPGDAAGPAGLAEPPAEAPEQ